MPKALLTGAAGGIGQATAHLLWEKGFSLLLTDVQEEALIRAFPELPAGSQRILLDVTNPSSWKEIAANHSEVDVLIQLAGVMRVGTFIEQPLEEWLLQVDINLHGVAYGSWTFGRLFAERGKGHIINIASMAGVAPIPGIAGYTATKFGVRGLSLALDAELRPRGVPVTVIGPGPVETPLILRELPKPESVYTLVAGGLLKPQAVAQAVWRAIRHRPKEILLPSSKAVAARLVSIFPSLQDVAARTFLKGAVRRRNAYLREGTPSESPS
ncbi:MAG: SDR family NAD(P)-dependent oxidoreductase [Bacteroidia bacterium]|nr:SDR family NAD(P)-dependent oxidoreductase [Bacteroidia bacterium]